MKKRVEIKIDKDIPVPISKTHFSLFPFEDMEIGDSFFVDKSWFQMPTLIQLRSLLWRKSVEYRKNTGHDIKLSFHTIRTQNGVRTFRIE